MTVIEIRDLPLGKGTLTLAVANGQAAALLGGPGTGKSAALDRLTGNLPVERGQVAYCGRDLADDPIEAKACMGFMPAGAPLYEDLSLRQSLKFLGEARQMDSRRVGERTQALLKQMDLDAVADQPLRRLTAGAKRLAGLAQALLANPPVLILDEPTAGLDARSIAQLRALLTEIRGNHAVLLTSRVVNEAARLCDEVVLLGPDGIAARGTPDALADQMVETDRLTLRIRAKAEEERAVRTALDEGLRGVAGVLATLEGWRVTREGWIEAVLRPGRAGAAEGLALREALFWAASRAGFAIVEMRLERVGLDALLLALAGERMEEVRG
jgi:ABC-2 type transport system ATP-binding protein